MIKVLITGVFALLVGLFCLPTWAVFIIDITEGDDTGIRIAVVPFHFQGQQRPKEDIREIVSANLYRTGQFLSLSPSEFLSRPGSKEQIRFKDWRLIKAEALVIGQMKQVTNNQFEVTFYLFDVYKEIRLEAHRWTVDRKNLRHVAHQISDIVYEALTGIPGDFYTRIAYVTVEQDSSNIRQWQLMVADSDGYNARQILRTNFPILSPAWAPDGKRLAYVLIASGTSGAMIWVQNVETGERRKLLQEKGTASGPAWSPDGRRLALRLTRERNYDIYILDVATSHLTRLTKHPKYDGAPAWSPDGRYLVFTSERSGDGLQIYRISAAGGPAERLTWAGKNDGASYSPNGKHLVMVTDQGNGDRIGVFYTGNNEVKVLTDGQLDETPTYSPNGAMIMYATKRGNQSVLVVVSADGRIKQILRLRQGEIQEPAWSSRKR